MTALWPLPLVLVLRTLWKCLGSNAHPKRSSSDWWEWVCNELTGVWQLQGTNSALDPRAPQQELGCLLSVGTSLVTVLYFFSFPVSLPHFLGVSDRLLNNLHLSPCHMICLWGTLAKDRSTGCVQDTSRPRGVGRGTLELSFGYSPSPGSSSCGFLK